MFASERLLPANENEKRSRKKVGIRPARNLFIGPAPISKLDVIFKKREEPVQMSHHAFPMIHHGIRIPLSEWHQAFNSQASPPLRCLGFISFWTEGKEELASLQDSARSLKNRFAFGCRRKEAGREMALLFYCAPGRAHSSRAWYGPVCPVWGGTVGGNITSCPIT
jgi:hypothetical protein